MKTAVFFTLSAFAPASPALEKLAGGAAPLCIVIFRQVQVNSDALGAHSSDFESANAIVFQFSGSEGVLGGANMIGSYSYPQEDGTLAEVTFVADENGLQPRPRCCQWLQPLEESS